MKASERDAAVSSLYTCAPCTYVKRVQLSTGDLPREETGSNSRYRKLHVYTPQTRFTYCTWNRRRSFPQYNIKVKSLSHSHQRPRPFQGRRINISLYQGRYRTFTTKMEHRGIEEQDTEALSLACPMPGETLASEDTIQTKSMSPARRGHHAPPGCQTWPMTHHANTPAHMGTVLQ